MTDAAAGSSSGAAPAGQRPVRAVAGARAGRHPRVRHRPLRHDPHRGGGPDRPDPGHGAALPAHPRRTGLRPDRRQDVRAHGQGAAARVRLPVRAVPAAACPAAPRGAVPQAGRIHVRRGAGRHGHRLHRPGHHPPDHERRHHGGHPVPGLRHVDGQGAARRPSARRAEGVPGRRRDQAADAAGHRHRFRSCWPSWTLSARRAGACWTRSSSWA